MKEETLISKLSSRMLSFDNLVRRNLNLKVKIVIKIYVPNFIS